jgi:hypothetical protein
MNYNENFDAGYVDYDDPTSYEYAGNNLQAGAYDQSGFYQNNQVSAPYGEYYDQQQQQQQSMYGNYNPGDQFNPAAAASSKSR